MPHRTSNVSHFSYMTVLSLAGVPKMVLTRQHSPSYVGISIKALRVRVARSNSSFGHTGKQMKGCRVIWEQVQSSRTDELHSNLKEHSLPAVIHVVL